MNLRVASRWIRRLAAQVGTDTGEIYAIAPETLRNVIKEGEWADLAEDHAENTARMADIIREHGGAVFWTGGDGTWDVDINIPKGYVDVVKSKGYKPPYGTPDYGKR